MSYILDALRRADAERERGHVPGIHAQPTRVAAPASGVPRSANRAWLWGVVVLLLVLLGALSWRLLSVEGNVPAIAAVALSRPAPVPVPTPVAAEATPAPPASSSTVAPAISQAAPLVTAVAPTPVRRPPSAIVLPGTKAAPTQPAAASGATDDASVKVYAQEELPDDIRRELPKLAIGGSIYSDSAASRFVIVNGQLLHEGDTISPGLVLQQIKLKSAVLSFRGYRYRINF